MGEKMLLFCSVFVVLVGVFFTFYKKGENVKLLIIVLSSRTNFEKREAVRSTWAKLTHKYKNVTYLFVVGKGCLIPPLDRQDEFSCSERTGIHEDKLFFPNKWASATCQLDPIINTHLISELEDTCFIGFGFKVLHSVKIIAFIINYTILNTVKNLSVVFKDPEEIFEEIPLSNESCSYKRKDFCYIKLKQTLILPKGFEGEISLIGEELMHSGFWSYPCSMSCSWAGDPYMEYTFGRTRWTVQKWKNGCSFTSAEFVLEDEDSLKNHFLDKPHREANWLAENEMIDSKIILENSKYKDIVFLPGITDTYRNLPLKVLEIFKWIHKHYSPEYVLKVDDDTYVDIEITMKFLPKKSNSKLLSIWAHFHYHRAVPVFGKWADYDYQGLTYPPFPSGAGYLISGSLVSLLADFSPKLRSFQGEDISMGIWTEFLQADAADGSMIGSGNQNVRKINVFCWLPSKQCNTSFIIPQLTVEEMVNLNSD